MEKHEWPVEGYCKLVCPVCGCWILAREEKKMLCKYCLKEMEPDINPRPDTPHEAELRCPLVVCDACHKLIHHIRVYHNYHQVDNVNKYHTYEAYKKVLNAMDIEPDFHDRLLKGFAEIVGV